MKLNNLKFAFNICVPLLCITIVSAYYITCSKGGDSNFTECKTHYDCQPGWDCNTATSDCVEHDYGDIGDSCDGGCESGFCLVGEGNVCTNFCSIQHDCPDGWGCRLYDDGSGGGHKVKVCVQLPPTQGDGRYNDICQSDSDCRSNFCVSGRCRETCGNDSNCNQPFVANMYCGRYGSDYTICLEEPDTGNDPLGTPGCLTYGSESDCRSDMGFALYQQDADCSNDLDCQPDKPTCWDLQVGDLAKNECVRDFCVEHCCSYTDCPDFGSDIFFCGKSMFGTGDFNVCLLHEGSATKLEGEACANNNECRTGFCSPTDSICRKRCCTDENCTNALYPRCALEQNTVYGVTRLLNVCLPLP